jgi:hypothetical protein
MAGQDDESGSGGGQLPPGTMAVVGEIIKASADSPNIKAAGGELGKAVLTVAKALNVVLLPIAAITYGYDRARDYFQSKFEPDLNEKLAAVPPEDIVAPKPSLAGPVLQGLAFSHDEDALRDMYLNLLASAMNRREVNAAQPAFVEIIKQLTAEEAQALCTALAPPDSKEIVQVRLNVQSPLAGWTVLLNHLMSVRDAVTGEPIENAKLPAMIDNWIRLGLVDVSYVEFLQNQPSMNRYAWAQSRPEFKRIEASVEQSRTAGSAVPAAPPGIVIAQPGRFRTTAFGTEFYRIVGLDKIRSKMFTQIPKAKSEAPIAG